MYFCDKMNRKNIRLIVVSMSIALIGVMAMQYFYIKQSLNLKAQLFDESVHAALSSVALKAEKNEVIRFINARQTEAENKRKQTELAQVRALKQNRSHQEAERMRMESQQVKSKFIELEAQVKRRHPNAVLIDNDFYETYMRDPQSRKDVQYEISTQNVLSENGRIFQQKDVVLYVDRASEKPKKALDDSVRYFVLDPIYGGIIITLPPKIDKQLEQKIHQLEQEAKAQKAAVYMDSVRIGANKSSAIENLADDFERSKQTLRERIDPRFIEDELKLELQNRAIHIPFNFSIQNSSTGKEIYHFSSTKNKETQAGYTTALFPTDPAGSKGLLEVYFPDKQTMLQANVNRMLALSLLLLLVLIGCFAYTILTILKQKKVSEMKTDFINNMTHEFKTPVATIMIASESLKDPEIARDEVRAQKLASIIYDENVRLGNHIERVLNIAKMDKGELELNVAPVEINDLLSAVVDSMHLQFQKSDAEVLLDLNAKSSEVLGDEFHLSNVFFNLFDNAIKYGKEQPHIWISTWNTPNALHIGIRDNGIGMSRDKLSKIFDQFYRIPTGNVHDVKGFGLGLSYVYDIVKRLNGTVKVKSELHKGTEFEIILPSLK